MAELGQGQAFAIGMCLGHRGPGHQILLAVANPTLQRLFTAISTRQDQGACQQLEGAEHHETLVRAVAVFLARGGVHHMYAQTPMGFGLQFLQRCRDLRLLAAGKAILG